MFICAHKDLAPLDARDYTGFALAFIASAVAAGGGIGGGGLLVPLFVLVLAFTPHDATPLSNVAILGGAIANLALNLRRHHPSDELVPLISFEVALMMEPTTIAGALVGVVLNKIFPGWLITVMLVVLLGLTARRTMHKGIAAWRKESAAAVAPRAAKPLLEAELKPAAPPLAERKAQAAGEATSSEAPLGARSEAPGQRWATRLADMGFLVCVLGLCSGLAVLRGRNRRESLLHLRCGSPGYWSLLCMQLLLVVLCALGVRTLLMRRHAQRVALGYAFRPDDVLWTSRNTIVYPLTCAAAGLCAGMFGIGGGIIKGPLMLEMGLHPQVSSATAAYMILFTSAAATMEYAIFGTLRPHYGTALFAVGFVGTVVGQVVVGAALRRYKKESIIVLIIAGVIGTSAVLMGVIGVVNFVHGLQVGEDQGWRALCEPEAPDR